MDGVLVLVGDESFLPIRLSRRKPRLGVVKTRYRNPGDLPTLLCLVLGLNRPVGDLLGQVVMIERRQRPIM